MQKLTSQEQKIINEFKLAIKDQETKKRLAIASYLVAEIEYQFGTDVMEFIVGYQSGLMQNCNQAASGEVLVLAKVGNFASDGFSAMQGVINDIMTAEVYEKVSFNSSSDTANELSTIVNKMIDSL